MVGFHHRPTIVLVCEMKFAEYLYDCSLMRLHTRKARCKARARGEGMQLILFIATGDVQKELDDKKHADHIIMSITPCKWTKGGKRLDDILLQGFLGWVSSPMITCTCIHHDQPGRQEGGNC